MKPVTEFFDGTCPVCSSCHYNGMYNLGDATSQDYHFSRKDVKITKSEIYIQAVECFSFDLLIKKTGNSNYNTHIVDHEKNDRIIHKDSLFRLTLNCNNCGYKSIYSADAKVFLMLFAFSIKGARYLVRSSDDELRIFHNKLVTIATDGRHSVTQQEAIELYENYILIE